MTTKTAAKTATLSRVVAANIRAHAAMRGWTQAEMCRRLGMTPVVMSDRYRERTPWTLDETEKVAHLFGLEVGDLTARPKGFEPLTFWLGADNTLTGLASDDEPWWLTLFCDECGWTHGEDPCAGNYNARQHVAFHESQHGAGPASSLLAERYPMGARA
ncbi:MAG TPA: helix-turn-helix transcriptional regulator [Dermatophilaceae bacterium]|nr:helix-turn-helix transcriptional regulator [Dermatophilaceae bacterium]